MVGKICLVVGRCGMTLLMTFAKMVKSLTGKLPIGHNPHTSANDKENRMKTGDLVRMNEEDYPRYKGKVGVVVEERRVDCFVVNVDGKDHPFFIHRTLMEKVN